MKAFITGYPGTGKSTQSQALEALGYTAYDTECIPGLTQTVDMKSGLPIAVPANPPRHWYNTIAEYNLVETRMLQLLASPESFFICSFTDNQQKFYSYYDRIFVLILSSTLLAERIASRSSHDYGKQPNALADILEEHESFNQRQIALGAIPVDCSPPAPEVTAAILRHCGFGGDQNNRRLHNPEHALLSNEG